LTDTIGAEDMHILVTEILQQLLYKKYDMLVNFNARYIFEIKKLKRSIDKYISAS